ncbi:MerR family transcriptional regulator [Halalkalibacter urbisdiaboli]|uniref:MerR family transcriptional regulator n=1 Tax=Halalkalibacter urbisdiaboli TaxID=1960589 RepID=UPI000B44ED9B|nr:MerR family transcriptional regulator [Halalkalibacter urbisdiaboli]
MKVRELADLVGISVRTLHYYDEIGLLSPDGTTEAGYRLYSTENVEMLQQILFFRELGFPLKEIRDIISKPSFDRQAALVQHRTTLIEKQRKLETLIHTIDKTLQHMKGEIEMTNQEKFAGFDFSVNPYEQEARERWGDKPVNDTNARLASLTENEQNTLTQQCEAIYTKLASIRNGSPYSPKAQATIKEWFKLLNRHFGNYSLDAFKGLGKLYVDDERFTKNIDQYGDGLAAFMCEAMANFADEN